MKSGDDHPTSQVLNRDLVLISLDEVSFQMTVLTIMSGNGMLFHSESDSRYPEGRLGGCYRPSSRQIAVAVEQNSKFEVLYITNMRDNTLGTYICMYGKYMT